MTGALLNGVLLGMLYGGVALGLALVAGVMRLPNLAHSELLIGAAFLIGALQDRLGWDPLLCAALVAPVMFAIAYPVQRMVLTPTMLRGFEPPLVAAFGISMTVQTLLVIAFSSNPRSLQASYSTTGFELIGVTVRAVMVVSVAVTLVLALVLFILIYRTSFGRELRAAAEDPATASAMGVNVAHIYGITLGLSAIVATFGGGLIGTAFSFAPLTGLAWLLRAFTVAVIGGLGSIEGALLGGVLLGIAEELGGLWIGPQYRDVVAFAALVLVLVLRPAGLLAGRGWSKAAAT
ncbi:MAG: branched-chain amino acid ABC transporter permease [Vicinamibacterales bacterium]